MFVQVIQGKVNDPAQLRRQIERWQQELKPGAKGYLGSTSGTTADGRDITVVRFESEADARANSERPEQGKWWGETAGAYDGEPVFQESSTVDQMMGGGSDAAGFVQVVQGKAKDQASMRSRLTEIEGALRRSRPDILGVLMAWHDGGAFTEVVYFGSEDETRKAEKATEGDELRQEFMSMIDGEPSFYDLTEPVFD
jgi:hypothetical protein